MKLFFLNNYIDLLLKNSSMYLLFEVFWRFMKKIINIGGVLISLEYDSILNETISESFEGFFLLDDIKKEINAYIKLSFKEYWPERVDFIPADKLLKVDFVEDKVSFRYYGVDGYLNLNSLAGEFYIENSKTPLYFLFRFIYVYLMPRFDTLYLHSSAVFDDENGVLSLGVSEAGKTTFALMAQKEGFSIVHDDLVLIKKIDSKFYIIHTPIIIYHMEFAKFDKKLLTHMFFLKKSSINKKTVITKKEFIRRLFRMILSFSAVSKEFFNLYFEIASDLYNSIETSTLEVFPEDFNLREILKTPKKS